MAQALNLFNTLTRKKELFKPLNPPKVGLYTCGPTVYNFQHIGNYRTYIFEDILARGLKLAGYQVRHVMNITDVGHLTSQADEGEDKMEVGARREGKTAWQIAEFYTQAFLADIRRLNIDFDPKNPEDILCKATDNIPEQIALVSRLEKNGYTYRISDGIYYDTSKFKDYGRLAGQEHTVLSHIGGIQIGARIQANPEKRHASDFALWKFAPKGSRQMEWDSPWGWGFPGWHIECSAMAMKYLGETFDIHCGGVDHIPIHHTNEIAQAEGATGKPFVRVWMHGEFLLMNSAKMAKSAGGFIKLSDLAERGFDPLDYRYHCLSAHYRKQLEFTWEALEAAKTGRRRLIERFRDLSKRNSGDTSLNSGETELSEVSPDLYLKEFKARLADDLDMPGAMASVWKMLADKSVGSKEALATLTEAEKVMGLGLDADSSGEQLPPEAQKAFDAYVEARTRKDFAASDVLRKQLSESGIEVLDSKEGSRWRKK